MPTLTELFSEYGNWYKQKYVAALLREDADWQETLDENGWADATAALKPLDAAQVNALTAKHGPLPASYVELLTTVGVGNLMAAAEDEPMMFRVLRPSELGKAHKMVLRGLNAEERASLAAKHGVDARKLLPIIAQGEPEEEWAWFVVLLRRDDEDDGVVLFDHHDHETGRPFGAFKPKPLPALLERWVRRAKQREPLDPHG